MIVWQWATFLEPTSQNSAIQKIKYGQFVEASVKQNSNLKASHTVESLVLLQRELKENRICN